MKKKFKIILFVLIGLVSSILIFTYICPAWFSYLIANITFKDTKDNSFTEISIERALNKEGNILEEYGFSVIVKEKYDNKKIGDTKLFTYLDKNIFFQSGSDYSIDDIYGKISNENKEIYFEDIEKIYGVRINSWFDYNLVISKTTKNKLSLFNNKTNVLVSSLMVTKCFYPKFEDTIYINSDIYKGIINYNSKDLSEFNFYRINNLNQEYRIVFLSKFSKEEILDIIKTIQFTE